MSGLLGAFLVEVGLVTYRSVTQGGIKTGPGGTAPIRAPLPSLYTSALIIYGSLAVVASSSQSARPVATLVGWGFVVATFLNLYVPGSANAAAASSASAVQGLTPSAAPTTPGHPATPTWASS